MCKWPSWWTKVAHYVLTHLGRLNRGQQVRRRCKRLGRPPPSEAELEGRQLPLFRSGQRCCSADRIRPCCRVGLRQDRPDPPQPWSPRLPRHLERTWELSWHCSGSGRCLRRPWSLSLASLRPSREDRSESIGRATGAARGLPAGSEST